MRVPEEARESQAAAEPVRLQFGIGTLLAVMAGVALTCSLLIAMPNVVATPALILVSLGLPAILTTVAVYGDGTR